MTVMDVTDVTGWALGPKKGSGPRVTSKGENNQWFLLNPNNIWVFPKIWGFSPKMDGLFHGKPYVQMDDLGGFHPLFSECHPYFWLPGSSTVKKIAPEISLGFQGAKKTWPEVKKIAPEIQWISRWMTSFWVDLGLFFRGKKQIARCSTWMYQMWSY